MPNCGTNVGASSLVAIMLPRRGKFIELGCSDGANHLFMSAAAWNFHPVLIAGFLHRKIELRCSHVSDPRHGGADFRAAIIIGFTKPAPKLIVVASLLTEAKPVVATRVAWDVSNSCVWIVPATKSPVVPTDPRAGRVGSVVGCQRRDHKRRHRTRHRSDCR